jgi:hypothetical protein
MLMKVVTDDDLVAAMKKTGSASGAAREVGIGERTARRRIGKLRSQGTRAIPLARVNGCVPPRILIYDIETSPNLAYVWRFFKENISPKQVLQYTDVLCWAAKWVGNETVVVESRENDEDDERICRALWEIFDKADIVVAHNGNAFDQKTMRARWVSYGMDPPSPYKEVDTLRIAKHRFNFPRNKLESIANYLDIGGKMEHEGFGLWTKCLEGDKDAWARMMEYNVQDVVLLEQLYMKLRAWDTRHPNVSLYYADDETRCVVCGGRSLKDIPQDSHTSVSIFSACRCNDCGKVMRYGQRHKLGKNVLRHSL